jgi:hypothetical protein
MSKNLVGFEIGRIHVWRVSHALVAVIVVCLSRWLFSSGVCVVSGIRWKCRVVGRCRWRWWSEYWVWYAWRWQSSRMTNDRAVRPRRDDVLLRFPFHGQLGRSILRIRMVVERNNFVVIAEGGVGRESLLDGDTHHIHRLVIVPILVVGLRTLLLVLGLAWAWGPWRGDRTGCGASLTPEASLIG